MCGVGVERRDGCELGRVIQDNVRISLIKSRFAYLIGADSRSSYICDRAVFEFDPGVGCVNFVRNNIDANRLQMSALVERSQAATGALQAAQAGNQILALQTSQLSDVAAVLAANGRSQALIEAERATAAEQGREQRRRHHY